MIEITLPQYYNKLKSLKEGKTITLIRRSLRNFQLGDTLIIKYKDESIYTELVDIQQMEFSQIPEDILIEDTAPYANNIVEAKAHVRSRYTKDIRETDKLYIFYLKKSEQFL